MRKEIWIFNHYATNMYKDQSGRHYWFAQYLIKKGYRPTIFCASTIHNSSESIDTKKENYIIKEINNINFVFIKTPTYKGNGKDRLINMFYFFQNLFKVTHQYTKKYGNPDIILASSVHPLTLIAGLKIAKKYGVKCICEIRDLWPESLVAYGVLKPKSLLSKLLYKGEKWIYKRADSIIMSWEGGKQYIINKGWENVINISKVHHISNGVDINTFDLNSNELIFNDKDLIQENYINIVYTGSIRKVNNIGLILDVAKIVGEKNKHIRFLIFGDGDELVSLKRRCSEESITNVIFKGHVEKKYIPYILRKSDINILHNTSTSLNKYGQSQNKLYEYLAAGKCIIQTYSTAYSVITKYECGISVHHQDKRDIASAILEVSKTRENLMKMGENARIAAYDFDFSKLTDKLINIIEN